MDSINKLQDEASAAEYLANAYHDLAGTTLEFVEAQLLSAVAAKEEGTKQREAAEAIYQAYLASKKYIGNVDFSKESWGIKEEEEKKTTDKNKKTDTKKKENTYEKEFNWIERLLEKLNKTTEKWSKSVDRMFTWWNKNWAINNQIKSGRQEIAGQQSALNYYEQKMAKSKLKPKYKNLVDNGAIDIQTVHNERLGKKIEQYQQWRDAAEKCKDSIAELYNTERDLITQKLDSIIEYFDTIQKYYDSIAGRIDSQITLKNAAGQKTTMGDLIMQWGAAYDIANKAKEKDFQYRTGASPEDNDLESAKANVDKVKNTKIKDTNVYTDSLNIVDKATEKNKSNSKKAKQAEQQTTIVETGSAADTKLFQSRQQQIEKLLEK